MKKRLFPAFAILICICLCFSGCNLTVLSANELIRPPKLSGESSFLQQAFEETVYNEFIQMKTPIKGENRSSYVIFDIDRDGNDDGLVFYSDPSVDDFARVAVFKQDGNKWRNVSVLVGLSEEIYEIGFNDINGDGKYEVLISWATLDSDSSANETLSLVGNRALTLYKFSNSSMTLLKTEHFTKMYVSDFNGDGADDIFLSTVNISFDSNTTTGRIITFNDDCTVDFDKSFSLVGMLDVVSIVSDRIHIDGKLYTRIYVDGALSEAAFVTEVIEYCASDNSVSFLINNKNSGDLPPTARSNKVLSADIDSDGIIEIPTLQELPYSKSINNAGGNDNSLSLVVWSQLVNGDLSVKFKSLYNKANNFYFIFDEKWISQITAVYNAENSLLVFYSVKNEKIDEKLFSIITFSKHDWNENNYDFDLLFESEAYVYAYKYEDNFYITEQKIKDNFVVMS